MCDWREPTRYRRCFDPWDPRLVSRARTGVPSGATRWGGGCSLLKSTLVTIAGYDEILGTTSDHQIDQTQVFLVRFDTHGSAAIGATRRVMPGNCLQVDFSPLCLLSSSQVNGEQPQSFVVGRLTRFLLLKPTGRVEIMGVRFKPGGAYRFLTCPLGSLTDSNVPTADIWGIEGRYLEQAVLEACDNARRQQLVEEFLLRKLEQTAPRLRLEATIAEIIRSRGQTRVRDLAKQIGLSSRQLEREFRTSVGLSPKGLARILRSASCGSSGRTLASGSISHVKVVLGSASWCASSRSFRTKPVRATGGR